MEIAIGMLGLGLTVLGLVFAYIWKSNGELQAKMMTSLEHIKEGQLKLAEMVIEQTKILERMEARDEKQTEILVKIAKKL